MSQPLLEVKNLRKYFKTPKGMLHAVDDVTFTIEKGKTLGVVGESGCGKSTTGRAILRLIEPTAGEVLFEGQDVVKLSAEEMRKKRTDMQIIFQDPFSSLNPRKTISQIIADPLKINKIITDKNEQMDRVRELMETVGLADRLINTYPHELDGGRRQRIGIARALALNPKFIVCDEPVSALDVSIQAQILNLMKQLQNKMGLTYMFITHDLSVVNHFSDDIAVMYLGQIMETADKETLFADTRHPYSIALLSAIPKVDVENKVSRIVLKGDVPAEENAPTVKVTSDKNGIVEEYIENSKGSLLPETGGIGTTIFYIVGVVLVLGAGVLLVTKKINKKPILGNVVGILEKRVKH